MADLSTNLPGTTPFGVGTIDPGLNAPAAPTAWEQSEARLQREQAATTADYAGSIFRQDGLVDGLVAHYVGSEMLPQEGYFAGTDPQFKELSKDLWPEHVSQLYQATSPANALFLKDRLLQKQTDLVRLGDMGVAGNVGRIAMNVLSPDALLMSMAGGWVTTGARGMQAYRATKLAKAAMAAERVQAAGKLPAVAGGIAFGAAENVAYEHFRQAVNFEDDSAAKVEAGLMGAMLTTPFALAGARTSRKVAQAARREHEVLAAMKKVEDGAELTPAEAKTLKETHDIHTAIRDLEEGRIDEDAFEARMDEFHGPVEPPDEWLKRYETQLRADTQSMIDELFPGAKEPPAKARKVSDEDRAKMDARVAREDENFRPKEEAPADPVEAAFSVAPDAPLEGQMAGAFRKALDLRTKKREAANKAEAERTAKSGLLTAEEVELQRQKADAWKQAEADQAARVASDQEAMIRARELARAAGEEDPFEAAAKAEEKATAPAENRAPTEGPAGSPTGSPDAPEGSRMGDADAPKGDHLAAARESLAAKAAVAEAWIGREVSWADPKTGETIEGTVTGVSALGNLLVDTGNGANGMKAVPIRRLDQWEGEAPEGFLAGSVGAAQVAKIASIANQRTAKASWRLDYFAILNGSTSEGVRELAFKLMKDAIQVDKSEAQGWTATEHKKQLQRVVAGNFHRTVNEALREAIAAAQIPVLQRGQFKTDFFELVSRATRPGGQSILAANPTIAPMLTKASTAMKEAYAKMLEEAQKAGVKGAKGVPPNDLYVNRMWDHSRIRDAISTHGVDKVVEVIANAIRVPGLTGDLAKARRFLDVVRRLEFSPALQNVHLQGRDMGTLRAELAAHGLAQNDIDDLVDVLFDARAGSGGDAGQAANLKFRFDLDESTSTQTPAGTLRLDDLFENDARVLMDTYVNSMAGHIGLARVGIDSQATWAATIKRISDDALTAGVDTTKLPKELRYLEDIHAHITGRPMSTADFSYTARTMQALRGYTRSVMLGQLGLTAAFEMNRAVATMGFKAVWQSVPTFRQFITALRQGHMPQAGLAEDVLHMSGFGTEMASSYARQHELEGGFVGGAVTRFEKMANKVSHVSDVISGNASFTSITRQVSAMAAARQAHAYASGAKKLSKKMRERFVGQGLDDAEIDTVFADLKAHSVETNGKLEGIRYEDWARDEPETYSKFQLFMSRQVRDAIQDQDIGETMPWMHTTIGKMLGELRTFMLVAHAKNFLKNLEYRDAAALQMWTIAFVAESMAYSMQAAINFPDRLDEKLTPDAIARAAIARMSINGLMPLLAETAYNIGTGGDTLFQPGATANTDNRVLWKTPSYMVATRLWNAPQTLMGMAGADTTTRTEFNELRQALPFQRLYGLPAVGSYFADTFPTSDPEKSNR